MKKNRGYFEVVHTSNQGKEKVMVDWKDNEAVIIASNCFSCKIIQTVKVRLIGKERSFL